MSVKTIRYYDNKRSTEREAVLEPLRSNRAYIQQIMPAEPGFCAVYREDEEPWIELDPILAWAVVRRYHADGPSAFVMQEVEPLVLNAEEGILDSPHDLGNFAGIVRKGDAKALEAKRKEAQELAAMRATRIARRASETE